MRNCVPILLISCLFVQADTVDCENGDRYNGKVLLVDEQNVKLQNEIAGTLLIPRSKVTTISFRAQKAPAASGGTPILTNLSALSPAASPEFDAAAVERVQREILGTANPEANQMFQEMVRGLMGGTLDVNDIRSKAKSALEDLKILQKELGDEDAAALLGSYGGILENFLKSTSPSTNSAPIPKAQKPPAQPEQK
jgi:hypothetical protein